MILLDQSTTYDNKTVVSHPIILLQGKVCNHLLDYIEVCNTSMQTNIRWPVVSGKFRAFVSLKPGHNLISLKYGLYSKDITYKLKQRQSPYVVQPLYIISRDGDGRFQASSVTNNSSTSAQKRISFGATLLQAFTAMNLKSQGFGSKTFQLPLDNAGLAKCIIFKSKYSTAEMYAMSDKQLWRSIAKEIMECEDLSNRYDSKFLAFLSCTRYNGTYWKDNWRHRDIIAATNGYIALGGGGLALLGTGTLHTWAEGLEDLVQCFTDDTVVDQTKLMDDSAYRGTYWANYATGLGAALHELGHTFDLSHTETGIMSRGFDNIHKFFVLENVPLARLRIDHTPEAKQPDKLGIMELCSVIPVLNFISTTSVPRSEPKQLAAGQSITCSRGKSSSVSHSTSGAFKNISCFPLSFGNENIPKYLPRSDFTVTIAALDKPNTDSQRASASAWSTESSAMLRFSRWFMDDDEISRKLIRSKPIIVKGTVLASDGLRVVQVYHRCLDRIVHSATFLNDDVTLTQTSVEIRDILSASRSADSHDDNCDIEDCVAIHVRDAYGNYICQLVNS